MEENNEEKEAQNVENAQPMQEPAQELSTAEPTVNTDVAQQEPSTAEPAKNTDVAQNETTPNEELNQNKTESAKSQSAKTSTNTKASASKKPKSNNKKIIAGVACVVVIAGVITGVALYKNNESDTTSKSKNSVVLTENSSSKEVENKKENSTETETKSTSKIDVTKPWIYNANYGDGKEPKTITNNTGKVYDSTNELIVPFININSEYANYINSELKNTFEKNYNSFGGAYEEQQITDGYLPQLSYDYSVLNNTLSVVIKKYYGVVNGDASREYEIYNFNLTTLNKASLSDLYSEAGFESEEELKACAEATLANEISSGNLISEDAKLDFNLCYLDENGNFNMLVRQPAGGMGPLLIKKGTVNASNPSNSGDTNQGQNTNVTPTVNKQKIEEEVFYFYAPDSWDCKIDLVENSIYKINSDDEYYEIKGKVNGEYKLAFSIMLSKSNSYDESSWANIGKYSDGKNIYQIQNFVCRDNDGNNYNDADYKFEKEVTEALDSLKVKFVVMNEFGSADTMKTLEGKYFFNGEAGTSERSFVYYIKDGNLCRTELIDDFYTVVLANDISLLYYNSSDHKIHAIPQSDGSANNNASEDNSIVYDMR